MQRTTTDSYWGTTSINAKYKGEDWGGNISWHGPMGHPGLYTALVHAREAYLNNGTDVHNEFLTR